MYIVSPERRTDESTLVVQSNVFAAHPMGDSFGDAKYFAKSAGIDVLMAERPLTGFDPAEQMSHKPLSGADYTQLSLEQAAKIDAIAKNNGYQTIKMIGRSAAASHLLTLTNLLSSDQFETNVAHTVVFEPVGMFKTTPAEGEEFYKLYIAHQKAMRKLGNFARKNSKPDPYIMPESTDRTGKVKRLAEMAWGAFVDKKLYSNVWAEDDTLQTITSFAQQHTPTKLDIVFAEHSMVLGAVSPDATDDIVADINNSLQTTGNSNIFVGTEPHTLHESGDLRSFMFNLALKHSLLP